MFWFLLSLAVIMISVGISLSLNGALIFLVFFVAVSLSVVSVFYLWRRSEYFVILLQSIIYEKYYNWRCKIDIDDNIIEDQFYYVGKQYHILLKKYFKVFHKSSEIKMKCFNDADQYLRNIYVKETGDRSFVYFDYFLARVMLKKNIYSTLCVCRLLYHSYIEKFKKDYKQSWENYTNNPPPKQTSGKIKISAWEILELERGASVEQIKSAYKRLALKYHPDKNKTKEAELKMRLLNDARNLLLKGN